MSSLIYGLDKLLQKHQQISQDGRTNMNPRATNLFEVVNKQELLKNEKELFLRQHLFRNRGGLEYQKERGLPDIKSFNKYLPNVLRKLEDEEVSEAIDNKNIIEGVNEVIGDEQSEEQKSEIQKEIVSAKTTAKKQEVVKKIVESAGKGVSAFSYSKRTDLEHLITPQEEKYDDDEEEKTDLQRDSHLQRNIDEGFESDDKSPDTQVNFNLTEKQKEKVKEIVGSAEYKEDKKERQAISILIIDTNGHIVANVPSISRKEGLRALREKGFLQNSKLTINSYGIIGELENGNIILSVKRNVYNKYFPKTKKEKEKEKNNNEENESEPETPRIPAPSTLKRRTSSKKMN